MSVIKSVTIFMILHMLVLVLTLFCFLNKGWLTEPLTP